MQPIWIDDTQNTPKYSVARVHYFLYSCTPNTLSARERSVRVHSLARWIDSFASRVICILLMIFNNILNLVRCVIFHIYRLKKIVYAVYELD